MSPLHNYPREVDGQCESCDCPGGNVSDVYVIATEGCLVSGTAQNYLLCDPPKEWVSYINSAPNNLNGFPMRWVHGTSTSLGHPTAGKCWGLRVTDSGNCTGSLSRDFATVMAELGYSSPADVPEGGYTDSFNGKPTNSSACCAANDVPGSNWYPPVPERMKFRLQCREFFHGGAMWWTKGSTVPPMGTGYDFDVCPNIPNGFYGGSLNIPSDDSDTFSTWSNYSDSADILEIDYEHGTECLPFPSPVPNPFEPTARVWWPLNSYTVDLDQTLTAEFSGAIDGPTNDGIVGYEYKSDVTMKWPVFESVSICDTNDPPDFTNISEDFQYANPSAQSSWCNSITKTAPDGTQIDVPRNIAKVRDGINVPGELTIKLYWIYPDSDYDPPPICGGDDVDCQNGEYRTVIKITFYPDDDTVYGGLYIWNMAFAAPCSSNNPCCDDDVNPACFVSGIKAETLPFNDPDFIDCGLLHTFYPGSLSIDDTAINPQALRSFGMGGFQIASPFDPFRINSGETPAPGSAGAWMEPRFISSDGTILEGGEKPWFAFNAGARRQRVSGAGILNGFGDPGPLGELLPTDYLTYHNFGVSSLGIENIQGQDCKTWDEYPVSKGHYKRFTVWGESD